MKTAGRCRPAFCLLTLSERSGQQAFGLGPVQRLVEGALAAVEHFLDLGLVDHERRAEGEAVAHGAGDEALFQGIGHGLGADALFGLEGSLGLLVLDQLGPADQADALGLADQRVVVQLGEAAQEGRRDLLDVLDDSVALVDLQRLDRDGAADGVAGIGVAVAEGCLLYTSPSPRDS